jgi:hypothetical protein
MAKSIGGILQRSCSRRTSPESAGSSVRIAATGDLTASRAVGLWHQFIAKDQSLRLPKVYSPRHEIASQAQTFGSPERLSRRRVHFTDHTGNPNVHA